MNNKLFLAHRGSWHHHNCIENTIAAFEKTKDRLSNSCHGFECDLRIITYKNKQEWIIFHDENLSRFGEKNKKPEPNKKIKLNNLIDNIPSLEDFKMWLQKINQKMIINIELKNGHPNQIRKLIFELNRSIRNRNITFIYSSFNLKTINFLIQNTKETVSYLVKNRSNIRKIKLRERKRKQCAFVSVDYKKMSKRLMKDIEKINLPIGVYFSSIKEYEMNKKEVINNHKINTVFLEN